MKIVKNTYIYIIVAIAIVVVGLFLINNSRDNNEVSFSPSPSSSVTPTPTPTVEPSKSSSPRPTPGIVVEEIKNYRALAEEYDAEHRYFALNETCTAIVPSQVVLYNNVKIMIDNNASSESRILKIGSHEYSLDAHGWILATLSSPTLPVNLIMYCGAMELGAIELQ